MFETLTAAAPDKILALVGQFAADPRPGKIDLGIGVYKDAGGRTPIPRVKAAERRLVEAQDTKVSLAPAGDPGFNAGMLRLVLSERVPERARAVQAPGGAGALRILAGLIAKARPGARIWHSAQTWVNHPLIAADAGLVPRPHPWLDAATNDVAFDRLVETLEAAAPGDVVLLHGCCHNPTGADLTRAQWDALAELLARRRLLPLIDLAYQGFGEGIDADAYGVRQFAERLPGLLVAASCSKTFGLYRERTGCAIHPDWKAELETMRRRMVALRAALAEALRLRTNSSRYDFLTRHHGLFSLLGLAPDHVARLREAHGIDMVGDGRTNVAGLNEASIDRFVAALVQVTA